MGDEGPRHPRTSGPEETGRAKEPSETFGDDSSQNAHWQSLLKRLGLETLQLPTDGTLAGQWKEFLEQFEAKETRTQNTRKERQ